MSTTIDRTGLIAGLESAGVPWRELDVGESAAYAVDGVAPAAICWPESYEVAAQALAVADRLGVAVSPRGAGTKTALGNRPRACDLIVSTERLDRVVEYAPANLTVTVQAGMPLAALQAKLAEAGQLVPLDPPNADRATLGGIIAANSSGPRRLGYGSARDLVIGTRVATTSGTVTRAGGRVVKNVAGYDLNKLYIGSLGTLVLVVEIGFKLAPRPDAQATVVGRFAGLDQVAEATQAIVRSPLQPVAIDLLNAPASRELESSSIPDARNGYLLAALGSAPGGAVWRQRDDFARTLRAAGADDVGELVDSESDRFWSAVVERPVRPLGDQLVRVKAAVPPSRVSDVIRFAEARVGAFGSGLAIGGRAASGILFLSWPASEAATNGQLTAALNGLSELREKCKASGGSLVIEACPLALKEQIDVWGDVGTSLPIMKRLKTALDPHAIMNPGRFVGGI